MPKVTALQLHTYDGKLYQPGETYEASDDYVDTLVQVLKWVELTETAQPPVPPPATRTRK